MGGITSYVRRAVDLYPHFVLGTGNEAVAKAMQNAVKNRKVNNQSYFQAAKTGFKDGIIAAENINKTKIANRGGFWKSLWKDLKTTPQVVRAGWRSGGMTAVKAGKTGLSKFWSQTKGIFKGLGKRMPLIGTLFIAATELPNIFSAFKDKGLFGGVEETAKAGIRLGGATVAGAIGQALIPLPFVGGLIGFVAGDWIMSKIVGKSHSEKKEEAQAQADNAAQQAQLLQQQLMQQQMMPNMFTPNPYDTYAQANPTGIPQATMTPQQLAQIRQMLASGAGLKGTMDQDFMAMTSGINKINYMG